MLLTLLCAAGVNFVISVPGADDVMLNYQSLSHQDVVFARETLGRRPAPEFEAWLERVGLSVGGRIAAPPRALIGAAHGLLERA